MVARQQRSPGVHAAPLEGETHFGVSSRIITGCVLALVLLVGCGAWAATAHLDGAVIASGSVKVDRNLKAIQHRDGGIVKTIGVREGDTVRKGQILIALEDVQTRAELSIVKSQVNELSSRRARLLAERDNLEHVPFPLFAELDEENAALAEIVNGETRLFLGNRVNRRTQTEQLEFQVTQLGEEVKGLEAQHKGKISELVLIEAEFGKLKPLFSKGLIENSRIYTMEREMARMVGERGGIEASMARAKARTSEIRLQVIAIDQNARTEAQRELSAVEAKLSEASERRIAIEDRLGRTDIRAPVDGTINELSVHTVGGVITPAEHLATLVPVGAELKIEARISPADIDQVSVGQPARLLFSTFNRSITPEFHARVAYISPATSRDAATNQNYYVAELEITDDIAKLGDRKLKPGMLVEVYITTEQRTAISYLLKPLTDKFTRAFREE